MVFRPRPGNRPVRVCVCVFSMVDLAQVQLRSPKVVVATEAAARAPKNGITFLQKIKSSSPIKYEHIRPLRIASVFSLLNLALGR